MWTTLGQQGIFEQTKVVTGLDIKPTHPLFGEVATKIDFLSHFFDGATDNTAYQALDTGMKGAGRHRRPVHDGWLRRRPDDRPRARGGRR